MIIIIVCVHVLSFVIWGLSVHVCVSVKLYTGFQN